MALRVLVTGGSGLLGRYLALTQPRDLETSAFTYYTNSVHVNGSRSYRMNVQSEGEIERVLELVQPNVIIHAAALGSVDFCEHNWALAHDVNVVGTRRMLEHAVKRDALFVFVSTNAVFEGTNPPYSENSARNPVNRYGAMKKEAEDIVMRYGDRWQIIRPILMYGVPYLGGRENWVTAIIKKVRSRMPVTLVTDTVTQPTYVSDVAEAMWYLIGEDKTGIFNIGNADKLSLFQLGEAVVKCWELDKTLLFPIQSSSLEGLAPRPVDTTYGTLKLLEAGCNVGMNTLAKNLERMKRYEAI